MSNQLRLKELRILIASTRNEILEHAQTIADTRIGFSRGIAELKIATKQLEDYINEYNKYS